MDSPRTAASWVLTLSRGPRRQVPRPCAALHTQETTFSLIHVHATWHASADSNTQQQECNPRPQRSTSGELGVAGARGKSALSLAERNKQAQRRHRQRQRVCSPTSPPGLKFSSCLPPAAADALSSLSLLSSLLCDRSAWSSWKARSPS